MTNKNKSYSENMQDELEPIVYSPAVADQLQKELTEIDILKRNIFDLNEQLYHSYKRIKKLKEQLDKS